MPVRIDEPHRVVVAAGIDAAVARQQPDQPSLRELGADHVLADADDAGTLQCEVAQQQIGIALQHRTHRLHHHRTLLVAEVPGQRLIQRVVEDVETIQIARRHRHEMAAEKIRRRADEAIVVPDPAADEVALGHWPGMNGDVVAFGDEPRRPVADGDLEMHVRIGDAEVADRVVQIGVAGVDVRSDADHAARHALQRRQLVDQLVVAIEVVARPGQARLPGIGQHQVARGAHHQAAVERLLERGDAAAGEGRRNAFGTRGGGDAAELRHLYEQPKQIEIEHPVPSGRSHSPKAGSRRPFRSVEHSRTTL